MNENLVAAKYEALLRPIRDNILKDWCMTLVFLLDDYMVHIEEQSQSKMNFSEVALVLQNSTVLYSKRVDVVHKLMAELVTEVCTLRLNENSEDGNGDGSQKSKKKGVRKQAKSLEEDDLQYMDFVASENAISSKIEKLISKVCSKQIVLNSSVKTIRKSGTTVPVYQSNGMLLGGKEEFYIFGKLCSDGTINDELDLDDENLLGHVDQSMDEDDCHENADFLQHSCNEDMEVPDQEPSHHSELDVRVPEISAAPDSPQLPLVSKEYAAAVRPRLRKNNDWEPISVDKNCLVIKPIKIKETVSLPKELVELGESNEIIADENGNDVRIMWMDDAIRVGTIDTKERMLQCEGGLRKTSKTHKDKENVFVEPNDPLGLMPDEEPHDFEDAFEDDTEAASAQPAISMSPYDDDNSPGDYMNDALKAIEMFKETRRRHATKATEIAERVAVWHESISPILEAAESRSKFDVHDYGTRILHCFPEEDRKTFRPFQDIVIGQPKHEICRYFFSSLMLANTNNLEIAKSQQGFLVKDCLVLRLISKVRHLEEMDEAFSGLQ